MERLIEEFALISAVHEDSVKGPVKVITPSETRLLHGVDDIDNFSRAYRQSSRP
jgi:hypothetical protein